MRGKLLLICSLLFTVPTEHKNRSMPYKERLPGGFHNGNLLEPLELVRLRFYWSGGVVLSSEGAGGADG